MKKDKIQILVVDDEDTICEVIKINLEIAGYDVSVAHSAEEALRLNIPSFSLIVLDVMMGEMSGFEMASKLRENSDTAKIPIIFCTAKNRENDLVEGFTRGADDYLCKPFSMKELVLRVKSILRRTKEQPLNNTIIYNTLILDNEKKKCFIDEEEISLTKKEFEMLYLLLSNKGKIFSREEILNLVWEEDVYVIDRTIDVNINRLRKKIKNYGNNITTKLGYGYGFQ